MTTGGTVGRLAQSPVVGNFGSVIVDVVHAVKNSDVHASELALHQSALAVVRLMPESRGLSSEKIL